MKKHSFHPVATTNGISSHMLLPGIDGELLNHHGATHLEPSAGCDEAGRGCLAGPVFAAAVILPWDFDHPLLNDSKLLSAQKRNILRCIIEENAIAWAVAMVTNEEIDQINILNASIKAMHLAIGQLNPAPESLLIDGNRFHSYPGIPHSCVIKGDSIYKCIAAASILAKTHRDEFMVKKHKEFPVYHWDQNKGYPTRQHRLGIRKHGISSLHRRSFKLNDNQTNGFLDL